MRRGGEGRDSSAVRASPAPGDATPWVWRLSLPDEARRPLPDEARRPLLDEVRRPLPDEVRRPFPESFFLRDAAAVARDLLGSCFRSSVCGVPVEGVVVETEAYVGPHDAASHGADRIGETLRNRSMFGPPGRVYVYRSYGIHWCLNVVTGESGFPAAVLIRALDPTVGAEEMARRRSGRIPLCAGPGRLAQALGVTGELDGHSLADPPLQLLQGWRVGEEAVAISGRIGIAKAADWPLRFYLRGHPDVSRGPRRGP
jgi:DNA-3-methyladenine glycosylase